MFVNFNILNQLGSPAINSNVFANRPAAGQTGRLFVSTDTFEIYRDNGTTWDLIGGPGSSTITGTGTAGTIPLWTSSSAIGDSDLRQLSTKALILNSPTNDWPTASIANDPGRILLTNTTNQPMIALWSKAAFGTGDEFGTIVLGAQGALGSTYINGAVIDGGIENNTDGAGFLRIRTTNAAGIPTTALTINSTQVSNFAGNVIIPASSLGIGNSNPGAALDIHSTGIMVQLNSTSATANSLLAFQRSGSGLWRIGDAYNGGNNYFELHNTVLTNNAIQVLASSNEATFLSSKTYSTGNAIGIAVQHNLTIPNGVNVGLAALGGVNSNFNLTLQGSTTVANTGRQGLEGSSSINFTGAGTLTMTQGSTVRAFSALSSVYAFNGSAVGTITHLAGLRICFPDNPGSAVNITNNYALLINDQTTGTGTVTYTNRWGIYQEGASDLNYFAANMLLGSTTNSGERLQVTGTAKITGNTTGNGFYSIGQEQAFTFQRTTGTASDVYSFNADSGSAYLYNNTTANSLMTWSETGNVGIGINIPTNPLHISSNTVSQLNVTALSGNTNAQINLEPTGTGIALIGPANTVDFAFRTNATERMRITSGGNVLIGTTTDAGQKLQVNGQILTSVGLQFPAYSGGGNWQIGSDATSGTGMYIYSSVGNYTAIFATSGNLSLTGSLTTGTPTGGTAAAWKLGSRVAATVVVNTTEYIEVDIGGTLYKLATVT